MPTAFQWARLKADVKSPLRRGAWYRILKLTPADAILDVRGKPVSVRRGDLQLSPTPALRWSVVASPKNSPRFPTSWGPRYAVCPNCRERARKRATHGIGADRDGDGGVEAGIRAAERIRRPHEDGRRKDFPRGSGQGLLENHEDIGPAAAPPAPRDDDPRGGGDLVIRAG